MQLTSEQVNEFLANQILESQLGQVVKDNVARVVKELSTSYNNPFDHVIRQQIHIFLEQEIKAAYAPILEARVKEVLATKMTVDFINAVVDAGFERIKRNY